ncbi:MAG: HAMP domain-containing sensor histidine kinase [Acidobacteriota bacterium]
MSPKLRRTAVAAALIGVAISVPCGAWLYAGLRQLDREASLRKEAAHSYGHKKALYQAKRLGTRLEALREAESRRPFYHYRNLFHDPKGVAEGVSVSVSPLAQGAADPIIEAHFQVDQDGHVSLPTVNEDFPELSLQETADEPHHCALLWKLHDVAVLWALEMAYADPSSGGPETDDWGGLPGDGPAFFHVERLDPLAWRQHLDANELYADLKYGGDDGPVADAGGGGSSEGSVQISVSPLRWHTLPVGGSPALVALRRVATPAGDWAQGFVVSNSGIAQATADGTYPSVFEPRPKGRQKRERGAGDVSVVVDGTPWQISLDISGSLADAAAEVARERASFYRTFLFGTLAALAAGLLVVALVAQSERLAEQQSQFAASAAHELRTPLAGLRLYGEMLAEGLGDPGRARDYARRIASEAERLGRVVTNVLSFTRLERGAFPVNPETGDLSAAVDEAYRRQRRTLEEAGAKVELNLAEGLPAVSFDRDAVGHIVQNLLDNAEKYTRDIEDRRIVVKVAQEAKQVILSVADNGNGVGKALRRRLFRPFARGDGRDAPAGLGLGLVLVRMLAQAQGAEITYSDAPAGGAVFRVAFPVVG